VRLLARDEQRIRRRPLIRGRAGVDGIRDRPRALVVGHVRRAAEEPADHAAEDFRSLVEEAEEHAAHRAIGAAEVRQLPDRVLVLDPPRFPRVRRAEVVAGGRALRDLADLALPEQRDRVAGRRVRARELGQMADARADLVRRRTVVQRDVARRRIDRRELTLPDLRGRGLRDLEGGEDRGVAADDGLGARVRCSSRGHETPPAVAS